MDDALSLAGKVAVVTGAGAGVGRATALALARAGADLVLNDLPGSGADVVEQVESLGGKVVLVAGDVGERSTADALISAATDGFGRLDIVVNNAGMIRDKMLFNMSDEDWDLVLRVHLRGHFLLSRNAAVYWRSRSKETGGPVYGRVVNTASESFLLGAPGQPNYAAAKAGIAALTVSMARGLSRYGVRANAICPRARTGMTHHMFGDAPADGVDPLSPDHVAPFTAYLVSPAADAINGQVFVVYGGLVALMSAPVVEQQFHTSGSMWTPAELADQVGAYFAGRDPDRTFSCSELMSLS